VRLSSSTESQAVKETLKAFELLKPKRPMTIKRFIGATPSAKMKVEDYLESHRQFLCSYEFLHPILEAYDNKELLPSPTLDALKGLLFQYSFALDTAKAEAKLEQDKEYQRGKPRDANGNVINGSIPDGNYLVSLMVRSFDKEGNCSIILGTTSTKKVRFVEGEDGNEKEEHYIEIGTAMYAEDSYGAAERKSHRLLVAREDADHCIIENQLGEKIKTVIQRGDGFAAIFRRKKQPFMKRPPRSTKRLGFGVKAKNSRSIGPWSIYK
jgi:hypothetical protein